MTRFHKKEEKKAEEAIERHISESKEGKKRLTVSNTTQIR